MTRLSDISSVHWQPGLRSFDVVEAEADVDQAIRIILATPKGSDPHRPTFGTDIQRYLDAPPEIALPHMVREATEAIRAWEPRCQLVRVEKGIDGAHGTLRIQWRLADGVSRYTEVAL